MCIRPWCTLVLCLGWVCSCLEFFKYNYVSWDQDVRVCVVTEHVGLYVAA